MTNQKVIEEFFHKNLPDHVRENIDFSSIQLQRESHIDDKLKSQIIDLLYKVNFNGKPGFLYLLIEHASQSHPLLSFRLLKYVIGVMEDHLRSTKTKELPLVYPLVLYTGKRPYTHTLNLFDLFPVKEREIAKQTLFSPYHLIDLTQNSDKELRKYLWYGTMARILKHIHDANILPSFKEIIQDLKILEANGEESYIRTVLTYVVALGETPHQEDLFKTIKELKTVDEEKLMTLADYLKPDVYKRGVQQGLEQGLEKGLAEGEEKSKIEIARNMRVKGVDIGFIASVTGISHDDVIKLIN
ncbi:MAG: Rpn family recombination-promoting nuclease/putative transposase [Alphaproteobacteria bacterium]|nr:Rpn family recombination-promoting nuclease/putative transposase [Alphaproteobacteria bacterium]